MKTTDIRRWVEGNFYACVEAKDPWEPFETWSDDAIQREVSEQAECLILFLKGKGVKVI